MMPLDISTTSLLPKSVLSAVMSLPVLDSSMSIIPMRYSEVADFQHMTLKSACVTALAHTRLPIRIVAIVGQHYNY